MTKLLKKKVLIFYKQAKSTIVRIGEDMNLRSRKDYYENERYKRNRIVEKCDYECYYGNICFICPHLQKDNVCAVRGTNHPIHTLMCKDSPFTAEKERQRAERQKYWDDRKELNKQRREGKSKSLDRKLEKELGEPSWDITISKVKCPNLVDGYCYTPTRRKCNEDWCPIRTKPYKPTPNKLTDVVEA